MPCVSLRFVCTVLFQRLLLFCTVSDPFVSFLNHYFSIGILYEILGNSNVSFAPAHAVCVTLCMHWIMLDLLLVCHCAIVCACVWRVGWWGALNMGFVHLWLFHPSFNSFNQLIPIYYSLHSKYSHSTQS